MPMGNIESYHQLVADDIVKKVVDKTLYDDFMKGYVHPKCC